MNKLNKIIQTNINKFNKKTLLIKHKLVLCAYFSVNVFYF